MTSDLHREKAAEIFGVPPEQVTPEQRRYAKTVNYVQAYGNAGPLRATQPPSRAQADALYRQHTAKETVMEIKARYIGPIDELKGQTALVKADPYNTKCLLAQFDDTNLGAYSRGWHQFSYDEFEEAEDPPPMQKIVIKMTQPAEWEPDEIKPELMKQRLRDW